MENILILNHTGWLGGAELSLLRYLERTEIPRKSIFCVVHRNGPLCRELEHLGYRTYPVNIPIPGLQKSTLKKVWCGLHLLWTLLQLAVFVRKNGITTLYANGHRGAFFLLGIRTIFPRIRLVTHVRDRIDRSWKKKLIVSKSDRIIVISDYVAENLGLEHGGNGKLTKIPSGVDTAVFGELQSHEGAREELDIPEDSFVFGMFCQVLPWKGVREYIQASLEIIKTCEHTYSIMVGDDRFSEQTHYFAGVKRKVEQAGFNNRILFTGFKKDVQKYIYSADVVISASVEEPLGQTLLQAMALGKPVIATRSGGPLEIVVDNETGLLVDPGDVKALVKAMEWLHLHRDEARNMGKRGKERFSRYFLTAEEMTEKIDGVLLENQTV